MVVDVILEAVLKELEVGCCDTFMRALRMVVDVILEAVLKELDVGCCDTFMRALRMVVDVILEAVLKELDVGCCDTFIGITWKKKAQKSRTCRLWLDSLIKPVLLMMSYVRAEREGDWLLHV